MTKAAAPPATHANTPPKPRGGPTNSLSKIDRFHAVTAERVTADPSSPAAGFSVEPPAAPEAEAALLGAVVLLDASDASMALADIVEGDFTVAAHQLTYAAIRVLLDRGEQPTDLAVLSELQRTGRVSSWPSASASVGLSLHALVATVIVPLGYAPARRAVVETAARRRLHRACLRLTQAAGSASFDSLASLVTSELAAVRTTLARIPLPESSVVAI